MSGSDFCIFVFTFVSSPVRYFLLLPCLTSGPTLKNASKQKQAAKVSKKQT